jgi:hypothetical protein
MELLEYMGDVRTLHGGTLDGSKSADELALANLTNFGKGKIKDECWNYGKPGHKGEECTVKEKDKGNTNNKAHTS